MQRVGTLRKWPIISTITICVVAPLAIWALVAWRPSNWLANRLQFEWEQAEDHYVDVPANQLAAIGEAGWGVLVQGLHSSRPAVRDAAKRTLGQLIASWQQLPADRSSGHVMLLARQLANDLPAGDSESLHDSADFAERLLAWPRSTRTGLQVVFDCEQVLRAARQVGWPKAIGFDPAPEPPALPRLEAPTLDPVTQPISIATSPQQPDDASRDALGAADSQTENAPDLRAVFSNVPSPTKLEQNRLAPPPGSDSTVVSPESQSPASPSDWQALEVDEILRNWRAGPYAAIAERELRRRGFDAMNLRVAQLAADALVENRLKLVRVLPQISGVNATQWLVVLARDESPRVRAAAVQMLSTATDLQVDRHLEKLEAKETDNDVLATIRKSRAGMR